MTDFTQPYAWPDGKRSAFCFTVDVDSEVPYLWSLRNEAPTRLVAQMEQRLFGPRTGIWRLLDLLDRFAIKGTFYVPGLTAENHPALLPAFVQRGHEVGLHGYHHEIVAEITDEEFSAALDRSIEIFKRQVGFVPAGFRSPAWEMTPHMLREIRARGFYDSSLQGADIPYTIDGVVEVPVQWAVDDAIFFKFVGGGGDKWAPSAPGPIGEGWLDEWTILDREGALMMLTVHDWISGRAQRLRVLERVLEAVTATEGAWIATVGEVAAHHAGSDNRDRFAVPLRMPERIAPITPKRAI